MKKILNWFAIAGALVALALFGRAFWSPIPADPVERQAAAAAPQVFASLQVGVQRQLDLELDDAGFEEATPREQRDQLLDWLLLTVLTDAGLTAEQLNQATFDLPARRHGALRPVAQFEFGEIRSRALPDGQVVVLLPARARAAERADHLAHAFDEQRKNLGEHPKSVLVFEYEFDEALRQARLTRRPDVPGAALTSADYGYVEQVVRNLDDLAKFMAATHELTFAQVEAEGVRLGGRRLKGRALRGIRPQDVAALWQSEVELARRRTDLDRRWNEEVERLRQRARSGESMSRTDPEALLLEQLRARGLGLPGGQGLQERFDQEVEKLRARFRREVEALGALDHSGFSLDPAVDFGSLRPAFEHFVVLLDRIASSAVNHGELAKARQGLLAKDVVPLLRLLDELRRSDSALVSMLAAEFNQVVRLRHRYQAARYDGVLAGTEVGMNLFYTDLLAKLWAIDFRSSAPSAPIPDFWPLSKVRASPVFERESAELTGTRLWFGHQDQGLQVGGGGQQLLFARIATRVYAASSSPLDPGKESEPNAESERFLGWWNEHFEEVARFEPEYERLNQIMKWSAVIGWLNAANQGERFGFLRAVNVDRSQWFPDWVRRHPELRYQEWREVGFFPRNHLGAKTETMPILFTRFERAGNAGILSGGVSLAPRQLFEKRAALDTGVQRVLRRSGLDYARAGHEGLQTHGKSSYRFAVPRPGHAELFATPREGARLRLPAGEMRAAETVRSVAYRSGGVHLETRIGGQPLGELAVERNANGFTIGWRGRDIDAGHALARRLARHPNALAALRSDPEVLALMPLEGQQFALRLRGQERWLRLAPERSPSAQMPEGWDARVADAKSLRTWHVKWIDEPGSLVKGVADDALVVAEHPHGQGPLLLRVQLAQPGALPPGEGVVFQRGGLTLKASRAADGSNMRVRMGDLRAGQADDPLTLAQRLATAPVPNANLPIDWPRGPWAERAPLVQELRAKQLDQAAKRIGRDPAAASRELKDALNEGIGAADELAASGYPLRAVAKLDDLIALHGPLPELTLRKGLAHIQRGRSARAAEAVEQTRHAGLSDPLSFLAEIEARIRQATQPGVAEELTRLHKFVEWRQRLAGASGSGEYVNLAGDPGGLGLHLRAKALKQEPVPARDWPGLRSDNTLLYVQDSPGLNNLDFSISLQQALASLPAGRLPRVSQVAHQSIAEFRPDKVFVGDAQVPLQLANKSGGLHSLRGTGRSGSSDRCERDREAPECRRPPVHNAALPASPAASAPDLRVVVVSFDP